MITVPVIVTIHFHCQGGEKKTAVMKGYRESAVISSDMFWQFIYIFYFLIHSEPKFIITFGSKYKSPLVCALSFMEVIFCSIV